ncbi:hypothetical protein [Maribacter arcticus]|uniref:GLPGLI family protein n=1 Tax=Maribacter arcticus TaxID=561365 RepID=A0A1T5E1D5_9FLAO|nr:hypothetical protein [Maribacter arcticus]SKB77837.1 hypothetical protein SAMN05660866_03228 [Maribacter arcticus]|tara:strand:+ start:74 stop:760 length:687 start_codon:yes stop_codon:yes gene_type:complete
MKIHLTLLIILISTQYGTSQTKESYEKNFGNFVIKVTDEVTQNYADLLDSRTDSIWSKSTPKFDNSDFEIPKPPPVLVYREEYKIHFFVKPKFYTQYTTKCDNGREIYHILKVDRETLLGTNFSPYFFELMENQWDFNRHTEDEFEILEYIKKDKKTICGFECYKVKIQTKGVAKRIIEMYVTEQIDLNYNPSFTNPHLLNKFYPLYIKEYLENYPNDVYKEYVFELE